MRERSTVVRFLNVYSQSRVIMSPLVRFGFGSIVQSNFRANPLQFVLSDEDEGERAGATKEQANKKRTKNQFQQT